MEKTFKTTDLQEFSEMLRNGIVDFEFVKKDGTTVELNIGENEDDPVFFISDLLPHLAQEQMQKNAANLIEGEALDIIIGNRPIVINKDGEEKSAGKDAVKTGILNILKETYDIEEEDFLSAELEVVPAGKAREAGFDNINIDVMYGIPEQTMESFEQTIDTVLALKPDHISLYGLTICSYYLCQFVVRHLTTYLKCQST